MEEIFEKLEEWETVDEFRKIAENILNRKLTTEELDGIENEDDDIVENLTREIFQTIEEDIPEDEREEFYDNHIDYLEYSKYDDEKLKRIGNLTGRNNRLNARGIIASIKDTESQIRAINSLQDDNDKKDFLRRADRNLVKVYLKSPANTLSQYDTEDVVISLRDEEFTKDYIKENSQVNRVRLIRELGLDFIKESLADEELSLDKDEKLELIKGANDAELIENALYDDSLELTDKDITDLLHSANDSNLISSYIHNPACRLNGESIERLIIDTHDKGFIKDCIMDETIPLDMDLKFEMVYAINDDIAFVEEILANKNLTFTPNQRTEIVERTHNIEFTEAFLEKEGNSIGEGNRYKLLEITVVDPSFIEKAIKETKLIPADYKADYIIKTQDQEFIKKCIYDRELELKPADRVSLLRQVADEDFVEQFLEDEQKMDFRIPDKVGLIAENYSQDFVKRCILNDKINFSDRDRYRLFLHNDKTKIRDDDFVIGVLDGKYDIIHFDSDQVFDLLQYNISERYASSNMPHILEILDQNGIESKRYRNANNAPSTAIYQNIELFMEREGVKAQDIPKYKEIIDRMYVKNRNVAKNIDFRFLNPKYLETLGEDKINQISCYPTTQQQVLGMNDKAYAIFIRCLDDRVAKKEQWTGFANDIIENLTSGKYDELIENCDLENTNIENLSKVLQAENVFHITSTEQINNVDEIRADICDKIMSGQLGESDIGIFRSYSDIDKKRFAILEKLFGQDLEKSKALVALYGKDIDKLPKTEENKEIIEYLNTVRAITEEENEATLDKIYSDVNITSNIDMELTETQLKSAYCEELTTDLFRITPETKQVGDNIYEAGTEFKMIVHSVAAYTKADIDNFEANWNQNSIGTQQLCTSYIRNDMMATADIPYFCYGFSNMAKDSLMLAGPENLTSGENKMKVSASERESYLTSDSLINNTGKHNELDFARYQGGKKVQPDYIVVFRKNGETKNFEKAKTAQQQWGGLPIVIVDQDKCLESEKAKTEKLFQEFEETSNPEVLKDAIQKIENNRRTDKNFCSDKNLETLTKQLNGMQKDIKEPKSQVTIQDLVENYEMVPAVDRQNESSKISRIFARVKQIQKEGAGYEL